MREIPIYLPSKVTSDCLNGGKRLTPKEANELFEACTRIGGAVYGVWHLLEQIQEKDERETRRKRKLALYDLGYDTLSKNGPHTTESVLTFSRSQEQARRKREEKRAKERKTAHQKHSKRSEYSAQ